MEIGDDIERRKKVTTIMTRMRTRLTIKTILIRQKFCVNFGGKRRNYRGNEQSRQRKKDS